MDIQLNGEPLALAGTGTVLALLQQQGLAERRVAVEVNGEIVPRSRHATHALQPGDRVEVGHALGGGWGGATALPAGSSSAAITGFSARRSAWS